MFLATSLRTLWALSVDVNKAKLSVVFWLRNSQVEETMLTPHAVAELTDPSSGLEQQLLHNQLEDLRREFSLLRHVPLQETAEPRSVEQTTGLDVLSTMVAGCLGEYTQRVSTMYTSVCRPAAEHLLSSLVDSTDTCLPCVRQVVTDEQTSKDPVEFVASLLDMQTKFDTLLREAFFQDKALQEVMRRCA
jgi:hypothetical protein